MCGVNRGTQVCGGVHGGAEVHEDAQRGMQRYMEMYRNMWSCRGTWKVQRCVEV